MRVQGSELKELWSSDEVLSNHYATSVYYNGYLYGFHGRQEYNPSFRAVELTTGAVKWSVDRFHAGTVTLAGDKLLILRETGELILADATPQAFQPLAQAQILPPTIRATPALVRRISLRAQHRHAGRHARLFRSPVHREIGVVRAMRKIDIFTHIYPRAFYDKLMQVAGDFKDVGKRSRGVPMLYDLDERFRVMDRFDGLPADPVAADAAARSDGQSGRGHRPRAARQRRHGGAGRALPGSLRGVRRLAAVQRSRRARCAKRGARWTISARAASRSSPTSRASRFPLRSSCRSSRRWPPTICRSGCTRTAARRGATIRPRTRPSSKSGGRSAGRTRPAWRWRASSSPGCSIAFPALKIISHHMGAMAPYFEGRVGHGWDQLGVRTSDQDLSLVLKRLEEAPDRLLPDVLRRHGADGRLRRRRCAGSASSASTTCCSRPTRRSIRRRVRCTSARRSPSSTACRSRPTNASASTGATPRHC